MSQLIPPNQNKTKTTKTKFTWAQSFKIGPTNTASAKVTLHIGYVVKYLDAKYITLYFFLSFVIHLHHIMYNTSNHYSLQWILSLS